MTPGAILLLLFAQTPASAPDPGSGPTYFRVDVEPLPLGSSPAIDHIEVEAL
jgi:hypothetical protein